MGRTRVLVVEDSLTIRKRIIEVLRGEADLEVVGEAGDGKTAIELCKRLAPNIVTMDMMLPVITGLAATEYIMAYCPTPILIVSASMNRGELFRTYDALAAGAVDVLEKPLGTEREDSWERKLVAAVRMVSRIKVITHPRARLESFRSARAREGAAGAMDHVQKRAVVGIGASTGGPRAVLTILQSLPRGFRLPVLIVVHISEPFGRGLADWLGAQTGFPVRYPRDGEQLPTGEHGGFFMAPPGYHLQLRDGRLRLTDGPERHSCRPSVDVLFESMAREHGPEAIACLLTGMGRDGAFGMLAVRDSGGLTIVQDEKTSVVFGMPGEAVRLGAASRVAPLGDIGPLLARTAEA